MLSENQDPFWIKSYESHAKDDKSLNGDKMETWKRIDTIDAWRHNRMYENVLPLIKNYPEAEWLTVGDGRFGTDANYLLRNNAKKVIASDITDMVLKLAKSEGFIQEYKIENAESLSFADNDFNFTLCKEAYHHFPRPMVAVYEMLRVSKDGVIIIEPNDQNVVGLTEKVNTIKAERKWQLIKNFIKDILGIKRVKYCGFAEPAYEPVGNYIYSVSPREFEKVALGLNYPAIAFKGLNDFYSEGVEFEKADETSVLFKNVKEGIRIADNNCIYKIFNYNLLVTIIFKVMPNENTIKDLCKVGFEVKILTRNPYSAD